MVGVSKRNYSMPTLAAVWLREISKPAASLIKWPIADVAPGILKLQKAKPSLCNSEQEKTRLRPVVCATALHNNGTSFTFYTH